VSSNDLIYPIFLTNEQEGREEISSMPGQFRHSRKSLIESIKEWEKLGLKGVCLFPKIEEKNKNSTGSFSYSPKNYYLDRIKELKDKFPNLLLMSDVALDPYSCDGHDGIVDHKSGKILNDETLEVLSKMSIAQAKAGVDIIGPSDMMDGRVERIRTDLNGEGFQETLIMSYSAKYASNYYGPFRDALDSAPKFGDKKTYQMDMRNSREALKEATLDSIEGADILMVKPGIAYLDIVSALKQNFHQPVSVYQVSGEYAMIKLGAKEGFFDETQMMLENLIAFKRAGADIILSYFSIDALRLLND